MVPTKESAADRPFDPYHQWLGIPAAKQPADHYRLLGVERFEDDPEVIENAADLRMAHLRTFQTGRHGALAQKLLNEVAAARVCLLNPQKRAAYDAQLRRAIEAAAPPRQAVAPPVPVALPVPVAPPVQSELHEFFAQVSRSQARRVARRRAAKETTVFFRALALS
jgi:hypothetical protein